MLAQRCRQCANIRPALGQCLVFAGATSPCTIETAGQMDRNRWTDTFSNGLAIIIWHGLQDRYQASAILNLIELNFFRPYGSLPETAHFFIVMV